MRQDRVDYRMQRRAVLRALGSGLRDRGEVCDAHPELVRAGRHLGTEIVDPCPVCTTDLLRQVSYVFSGRDRQRHPGGRAVPRETLARQAERYGVLTVYTVEVCLGCHWHHLVESYRLLPDGSSQVG